MRWMIFVSLFLLIACGDDHAAVKDTEDGLSNDAGMQGDDLVPDSTGTQNVNNASPPQPLIITTQVSVERAAAGETISVECRVENAEGEIVEGVTTRMEARPSTGVVITSEGNQYQFQAELSGRYLARCSSTEVGIIDLDGKIIEIDPGPIRQTRATVEPEVVDANGRVEVTCEFADEYGNVVHPEMAPSIRTSRSADGDFLDGTVFSSRIAGELEVECYVMGASSEPAILIVQPGAPENLVASLLPKKPVYSIGEVVTVLYTATDRYGNEIISAPIRLEAEPNLEAFGPNRFRLTEEGRFIISVVLRNTEPDIGVDLPLLVDDRGPTLDCTSPSFGSSLTLGGDRLITLTGTAGDLTGIESLTVDGIEVAVDANGTFSTVVEAAEGLNFIDLSAVDGAGRSSRALCGFFAAQNYFSGTTLREDTLRLDLGQAAIDDGDNGLTVKSFGDIARQIVRSDELIALIDGALRSSPRFIDQLGTTIDYDGNLNLGDTSLSLLLSDGGLDLSMGIKRIDMDVFGDSLCDFSGRVTVENVDAATLLVVDLQNGQVVLNADGLSVSVGDLETDFEGGWFNACGNAVDALVWLVGVFSDVLENLIEDALVDLLNDSLTGVLADTLSGLDFSAFSFGFPLETLQGDAAELLLGIGLSDISANRDRLRLGLATRFTGPLNSALTGSGVPSIPSYANEGYGRQGGMALLINADLLNQALYSLWRANFFEIENVGDLAGEGATVEAGLSLLAPPFIELMPNEGLLRLHFGPATGTLTYADFFSEPIALRFGAILQASVAIESNTIVLGDEGVSFEEIRLDIADSGLEVELAEALEHEIGQVVTSLLDETLSTLLPSFPVPSFELPASAQDFGVGAGLSLGVDDPTLELKNQTLILDGEFR